MISLDSIESPLFRPNMTLKERHQQIAELSEIRHSHQSYLPSSSQYHRTSTLQSNLNSIQPNLSLALSNLYILKTIVGTNLYSPYLSIDLSHDDTWMQCDGCNPCIRLRQGSFKYMNSSSYQALRCDDPLCIPKLCDRDGTYCIYQEQRYVLGTSKGHVGLETFTFPSANQEPRTFRRLAFGCGLTNNMTFGKNDGPRNVIAGIFGLGTGPRSFLTQLDQHTKGRFSYCLPPWTRQGTSTKLTFGDEAEIRGRVQTTPLIRRGGRYHLEVSEISVHGNKVQINPALFRLNRDGSGGFIIDSGVGHTLLLRDVYRAVRSAMVRHFDIHDMDPIRGVHNSYDLCFAKPKASMRLPILAFHFEGGATLKLKKPVNIFETFEDGICMIIKPIDHGGRNVLGAFQQANHRFSFDTKESTLSFMPEDC